MEPFLPQNVLTQPKRGFSVPNEEWGKTMWMKRINEIKTDCPELNTYINFKNDKDWSGQFIWQVLFFCAWYANTYEKIHNG
jgi:hypothetical protein